MIYLTLKLIVSAIYAFAIAVIVLRVIDLSLGYVAPIFRFLFILLLFTLFYLL